MAEIEFSNQHIVGGEIEHYLLEQARVTSQADGERNYHIFYQLCTGASLEQRKKFLLRPAEQFNYLKKCTKIGMGVDDAKEFQKTQHGLSVLGFEHYAFWETVHLSIFCVI